MTPRRSADTAAYLDRLGVDGEPPSADALRRLHAAQVGRIPYETFWLHLGEDVGIDPRATLRRLAHTRRGGYCFHLNGALALVLRELGYHVTRRVGGVHDTADGSPDDTGNHVALVVDGLPTAGNPQGRWWVDAGLGDGPLEPVPLRPGTHRQGSMALTVTPDRSGGWDVDAGGTASFAAVSVGGRPVAMSTFAARHRHFTTAPDSRFARTVTAQRRHAGGSAVLRGCVLTRTDDAGTVRTDIAQTCDEWLSVLADEFGLALDGVAPETVRGLWARTRERHHARLAAGATP